MPRLTDGLFIVPRSVFNLATDSIDLAIMVWAIGNANFIDSTYAVRAGHKAIMLKRGQIVTSVKEISEALKVPPCTIRGRLHLIAHGGFFTIETTSTGTIITINNYDEIQNFSDYNSKRKHNHTTNGPQTDHNILNKVNQVNQEKELSSESQDQPKNAKPKKKAKEPKPKKESSGAYEVIARYCELFEQKYQAKAKISGIDAGCLSRIAKSNGMEQGIKIVETYFAMNDSWISQQCYPASLIEKNLNKILVYLKRTENSAQFDYGIKPLTSGEE